MNWSWDGFSALLDVILMTWRVFFGDLDDHFGHGVLVVQTWTFLNLYVRRSLRLTSRGKVRKCLILQYTLTVSSKAAKSTQIAQNVDLGTLSETTPKKVSKKLAPRPPPTIKNMNFV